jgi:NTE family protein
LNPDEKVGIVLSGGGARAAYEVGVLKAIYGGGCPAAKGNQPEILCGTGAGAFNAAVIASRLPGQFPSPVDYLQSLWADEIPREGLGRNNRVYRKRLDTWQFLDIPYMWRRPLKPVLEYLRDLGVVGPELLRRTGKALANWSFASWLNLAIWHDTSPMYRLITESISLETIRDGEGARPHRSLRVVATERGSGTARVFGNADFTEDIGHSLVLASCALPIIFPAVRIQGREYMYGGLVMQTPLQPAIDAGATVIHLLHNAPREQPQQEEEPSTRAMLSHTIALALSAAVERDLDNRRRVNEVLDALRRAGSDAAKYLNPSAGYRRVVVHQYRPRVPLGGRGGVLDFTRAQVEKAIAAGESDAMAHDCSESGCIL